MYGKIGLITNKYPGFWNYCFAVMVFGIGIIFMVGCSQGGATLSAVPSISIDPQNGGANTQVLVSGVDFPPDTAVSVRLGPPDVGATPQTYGSGMSGADGRFNLSFIIPGQWPDGQPIVEPQLLVIVLNDDGSIKATMPFEFQSSPIVATEGVIENKETVDEILISNEQAIVAAVLNNLTQTGVSSQVAVSVEMIEGNFARVAIFDLAPDSTGKSVGFLKLVNSVWEVVIVGQNFDSDQLLELGIPQSVLPEEILVPAG